MSNYDFVPTSDAEFNLWQSSLISTVQTNTTAWGILAADVTTLVALQATWATTFAKASNKQNRTSADVQAKDDARRVFEKALRNFAAQWLSHNSKVTDSDRQRMGLTVKSATHTPVSVPSTSPTATIDFSVRGQHIINFVDETSPSSKAKPDGVHGCEIWAKIDGDAPKTDGELSYLATSTRTPYVANYDVAKAGKTAYYRLRWVNNRGQQGPWSGIVSGTIVG
jgi:hypothetical protein